MSNPVRYKAIFKKDGRFVLFMCFRELKYSEVKILAIAKRLEKYGDLYDGDMMIRSIPVIEDKDVLSERCIDLMRVEDLSR